MEEGVCVGGVGEVLLEMGCNVEEWVAELLLEDEEDCEFPCTLEDGEEVGALVKTTTKRIPKKTTAPATNPTGKELFGKGGGVNTPDVAPRDFTLFTEGLFPRFSITPSISSNSSFVEVGR